MTEKQQSEERGDPAAKAAALLEEWTKGLDLHRLKIHEFFTAVEAEQQRAAEALRAANETATATREQLAEIQPTADKLSKQIQTASDDLQAATAAREKSQQEVEAIVRLRADTTQLAEAARGQAEAAKVERDAAAANATFVQEARGQAEATLSVLSTLRSSAEEHERATDTSDKTSAALAKIARETEAKIREYENSLQQLINSKTTELTALVTTATEQSATLAKAATERIESLHASGTERVDALLKQIERLLPGATSAGLAAAFEARKVAVIKEQGRWRWVFGISLAGLIAIALWFAHETASVQALDWQSAVTVLVRRLPLLGPVLWLAIVASKQMKVLSRLEEEYAHKVVMSNSFEGYKRELRDLPADAKGPVIDLTAAVLETLRRSPVPLHDGKTTTGAPTEVLAELGAQGLDRLTKLLETLAKLKP